MARYCVSFASSSELPSQSVLNGWLARTLSSYRISSRRCALAFPANSQTPVQFFRSAHFISSFPPRTVAVPNVVTLTQRPRLALKERQRRIYLAQQLNNALKLPTSRAWAPLRSF